MHSRHHFPISLGVGIALVAAVGTPLPWPIFVGVVGLLGTAIDLDHFVIARVRTGSWEPVRRCLADPRVALLDQGEIFEEGDVGELARLGSHLVITALLVGVLSVIAPSLAVAAGIVLAVHIVCDIAWDLWRRRRETQSIRSDASS